MTAINAQLRSKLTALVKNIYPTEDADDIAQRILEAFWPEGTKPRGRARPPGNSLWSQKDAIVITYGNSVIDGQHKPLDLLNDFLNRYLADAITGVHILPFFPFTSDDGFSVTDYEVVNSSLGDWADINRIGGSFRLMSDLVLNHVSSQSKWFNEYLQGHEPYDKYFFEASPDDDLSFVVRPRAHPLLREVETANGTRHVWCTFSADQVDLNYANPDVLIDMLRVMRLHMDNGVRIIRLDAVAFIWKVIGTPCIHLPKTHAIVRVMRLLADYCSEKLVLLTETNVPNAENLSYFGHQDEAHSVYSFSLPPLMLHALLNGTSRYLNAWQMAMPPAQLGCAYLNFTASHDGIGMRPAEGLLNDEQIGGVIETVKSFGGLASMRAIPDGTHKVYELNIAFFDAMKGTVEGEDEWQFERFICSQTIMMALEGIPAFYIHSLLATTNDHEGVEKSQHNRAINRHRWDYDALQRELENPESTHARVLETLKTRIAIRTKQPAFHPNATQFTMQFGDRIFGFWRQSLNRDQSIFALHNVTKEEVKVPVQSLNLIFAHDWHDLLSGEAVDQSKGEIIFAPYQCRWITNKG